MCAQRSLPLYVVSYMLGQRCSPEWRPAWGSGAPGWSWGCLGCRRAWAGRRAGAGIRRWRRAATGAPAPRGTPPAQARSAARTMEPHLAAVLLLERHHVEAGVAEARRRLLGGVAAHQARELRDLLAHQRRQVGVSGTQHQLVLHLLLVVELLLELQQPRVVEALLHLHTG